MTVKFGIKVFIATLAILIFFVSCRNTKRKAGPAKFQYERFKDSVSSENKNVINDTSNVFDNKVFIPGVDSFETLLMKIDTLWHRDAAMMEQMDTLIKQLKNDEKYSTGDREKIKENIRVLDSFLASRKTPENISCREKDCLLYAVVVKSTQQMYLYIEGELKDSFYVSTGIKKHRTPDINVRPTGPLFIKYTSRKFPGGNYRGLGNMPYAVFVKGGYAIHGTTPGNFSKLGTVASHGCIRLHPDNARIFYELVKLFGLNNTWLSVRDSL